MVGQDLRDGGLRGGEASIRRGLDHYRILCSLRMRETFER